MQPRKRGRQVRPVPCASFFFLSKEPVPCASFFFLSKHPSRWLTSLVRPYTGKWYVGVNGDDAGACKYTISISKYSCPLNCSNRGECITAANNTRTCKCSKVCLCLLGCCKLLRNPPYPRLLQSCAWYLTEPCMPGLFWRGLLE